jgi:hypothetical protein
VSSAWQVLFLDGGLCDEDGDGVSDLSLGDIVGVKMPAEDFGKALATGDNNGDGYSGLAAGVPDSEIIEHQTGVVTAIFGAKDGLTANGNGEGDELFTKIETVPFHFTAE